MPPRKKQTAEAPPIAQVDLDSLFRKQSKARVVAERLLTGTPQTRAQLAEGLDLSLTTVPRVVDALTAAGLRIDRTTDRTRQAVYKVVGTPADTAVDVKHGSVVARFMHSGPGDGLKARITKVEIVDSRVWVEYAASRNGLKFRAVVADSGDGSLSLPSSLLSGEAQLISIAVFDDGELGFRFGDDRSSVLLCDRTEI